MKSELDKLITHFQSMYIAHKKNECGFFEGCLYCEWDATEPKAAAGRDCRTHRCLECGACWNRLNPLQLGGISMTLKEANKKMADLLREIKDAGYVVLSSVPAPGKGNYRLEEMTIDGTHVIERDNTPFKTGQGMDTCGICRTTIIGNICNCSFRPFSTEGKIKALCPICKEPKCNNSECEKQ